MKLTWLGHAAFHLETGGRSLLIDPFLTDNPKYPAGYEDKIDAVDYVVITHGHSDHIGDAARLAKKYDATVVSIFEICQHLGAQGIERLEPMNIGGSIESGGLTFSMVHAQHSSALIEEGGRPLTMGDPAGYVIASGERTVYHAGDTGIFSDMALIQRIYRPQVGLIPIGDRVTMGPETAAMACNELLDLEVIVPIHWGTWPFLPGDPQRFNSLVKRGEVKVPDPGETLEL